MDELRLILLFLGLTIIGGFVIYHRFTQQKEMKRTRVLDLFSRLLGKKDSVDDRHEPLLADEPDAEDLDALSRLTPHLSDVDIDEDIAPVSASPQEVSPPGSETLVVVLNIMAKADQHFSGMDVRDALLAQGLEYGAMKIYHYYPDGQTRSYPLCSVANTVEPGTLELEQLEDMQTPGLSLFMQLPGPVEGREALEKTLAIGRGMAEQLGGELCDETRSVLSVQTIGHLKEKIETFRFKQKMAAIKAHQK